METIPHSLDRCHHTLTNQNLFFSIFFSVFAVKDVDTKEKIADLESKIVELEKQNAGFKNKVSK